MHVRAKVVSAAVAAAAIGGTVATSVPSASADRKGQIKHVLLISVDGMHQSDLDWYIANHPNSELAKLAFHGAEFTNNHTSVPSDSDPGGTALMTGGDPRATGVYYDVEYNHSTYEAGTTNCTGPTGGDAIYDSPDDTLASVPDLIPGSTGGPFPSFDENGSIFPGGNDMDPAKIMSLKFSPDGLNPSLNSQSFPVDPATCQPIQPWDYLKVNTIFQVIHGAGLRTAWSDKHAVYSSFQGPASNGQSIDDLFSPEIDSQAVEPNGVPYPEDDDWAHIDAATKQYDGYKVQAIINEIDGYDHSRTNPDAGTPAIFGMNFQTVSVAQKIKKTPAVLNGPDANGNYAPGPALLGGYLPGTSTPRPLLQSAFDYVNDALQRMDDELQKQGLAGSTAIILTAKHGQSPLDPNQLKRIDDGPIIKAINQAYHDQVDSSVSKLIVAGTDDDLWQSYLSVKTQAAADFVKNYLWNHPAPAVRYDGSTVPVPHSGLAQIYAGKEAADFFGVPVGDPRHPDVLGRVQVGTVYTGGSKIAEHGGDNPGDREVPLVVFAPGSVPRSNVHAWVETTQVAPTILRLLGLNPNELQAVQQEGTKVLPGIG